MKESAKLQKEILEKKLANCEKSLEDLLRKKYKLEETERTLRLSEAKIRKALDSFGVKEKKKTEQKSTQSSPTPEAGTVEDFLNSLPKEERELISQQILDQNPTVEELKRILRH